MLPIQRIGASIVVNTDMLAPGWHLSEHALVYDGEEGTAGSESGQRSRVTSEYGDASDALFKTMGLLQAREQKADPGVLREKIICDFESHCSHSDANTPAGLQDSMPRSSSRTEAGRDPVDGNAVDTEPALDASDQAEYFSTVQGGDPLMVGGFGVTAGLSVKVGRRKADRGCTSTVRRKPTRP